MKKQMKRCIALLCAICMATGLTACDKDNTTSNTDSTVSVLNYNSENGTAVKKVIKNNKDDKLANVSQTLDVNEIKSNLKYIPQMFYGCYAIDGCYNFPCSSVSFDNYITEMDYIPGEKMENADVKKDEVTAVPFRIEAGAGTLLDIITTVTSHQWMCMYFQTKSGSMIKVTGAYEVADNTLTFTPLKPYSDGKICHYDSTNDKVDYTLSENQLVYQFSFNSPNLTLKSGDKSVTMTARGLSSGYDTVMINNYITQNSKKAGDIEQFDIYSDGEESPLQHFNLLLANDTVVDNAVGEFSDNGLFTFSWKNGDKEKAYQYYYFFGENDGLVLTDGKENYFYNDSYSVKNQALVSSISKADIEKFKELDEEQIAIIVEKKTNLLEDLEKTFKQADINVKIDKESGEIMLDSTILFGYDSSTLSKDGQVFLNKFLKAYSSVILRKDYEGFVSKILVEGHTDSSGSYEYNKKLSQSRADNVKDYCLSDATGLNKPVITALSKLLQSVGRSSDEPILDKKGKENEQASRRVTFKFNINLVVAK